MNRHCPDSECFAKNTGPNFRPTIRKGSFFRKSDGQWIPRFLCRACRRSFSSATFWPEYRQKKRKLNYPLGGLLYSAVSQRQAARLFHINRKTVVRKFRFLAEQARLDQVKFLETLSKAGPITRIQFDDLETSVHTKCKPLSVALAVEPKSRKILSFQVSEMPAKGPLAEIAFRKYGYRADRRGEGWDQLFSSLKPLVRPDAEWVSDQNPHYPRFLKRHYPQSTHRTFKGRRGCVVGQGELKKAIFDPLFSLNHTCAMLRAHVNRLARKTWGTTKTIQGLIDHLSIYVRYHNRVRTSAIPIPISFSGTG